MKVHELARELRLTCNELIERLETMKVPVRNEMSVLDSAVVEQVRLELNRPRVFFLAGIAQLILRELQIALTKKVLDQLKALRVDWWREGVLPYLNSEDNKDLLISCFGRDLGRPKPLEEVRDIPSSRGKEWFETARTPFETARTNTKTTPKSKDVNFLLRYMKSRPKDGRSRPFVWALLF